MRVACWIPKGTNTHSEYVKLIAFPLQEWLLERASVLRHLSFACFVMLYSYGFNLGTFQLQIIESLPQYIVHTEVEVIRRPAFILSGLLNEALPRHKLCGFEL
jgi:hypothetical protein